MDPLMRRLQRRLDIKGSNNEGAERLVQKALLLGASAGTAAGLALLGSLALVGLTTPTLENTLGFAIGGAYALSAILCASAEATNTPL